MRNPGPQWLLSNGRHIERDEVAKQDDQQNVETQIDNKTEKVKSDNCSFTAEDLEGEKPRSPMAPEQRPAY